MIDDTQTVTYSSKVSEGAYAIPSTTVPFAFWEPLQELDYKTNPQLLTEVARAVNLWTANLNGINPKLGDRVTDKQSLFWYVVRVENLDLDANGVQRYRLTGVLAT